LKLNELSLRRQLFYVQRASPAGSFAIHQGGFDYWAKLIVSYGFGVALGGGTVQKLVFPKV